jgi:RNA polymerase sigma-70 factor (ECF subfamily)
VEEAVRRAGLGDATAFEAVVGPELEDLRRLATAIVLDRQVADDVVQESLLAAWRGLDQLRDAAAFRTWLRRIVINRARNALRRPRGLRLLDRAATAEHDRDADPSQTWSDVVALEAAMRQLTGDQRACVALYYLEGRALSDIAELLHVPPGTVKSRLHAARARLREALE